VSLRPDEALERDLSGAVQTVSDWVVGSWQRLQVVEAPGKAADRDNPTTDLDQQVDARLRSSLLAVFEARGIRPCWLSEESADSPSRLGADDVLIVDPIDGTRNLVAGRPEASISIAWWHRGDLRWALVRHPFLDQTLTAWAGGGTCLNGRPVHVLDARSLDGIRLLVSRHEHRQGLLAPLEGRVPMEPVGSAAYKIACVAGGLCHGTFTVHPRSEWDLAAGALLVREAGGVVTDALGRPLRFNQPDVVRSGVVAAGPRLHPLLLDLVASLPRGQSPVGPT